MNEIKTLNFFGENGITSTSANHVANLAKEYVRACQEKLAAITFYDENISLIGQKEETKIHGGIDYNALENIPDILTAIAEAHSLIAFLREAIKEKEKKLEEARNYVNKKREDELKQEWMELTAPVKGSYPTEEQIKQTWSVGEQEKYLSLEAEAAALGKFIHEDAPMSKARIDLMRKIENPSSVHLNGADTIVHRYTPTIALSDVNEMFNSLQKRYRSVQAELNGMKKKIEDEIYNRKFEIDATFNYAQRLYNEKEHEYEKKKRLYYDELECMRNELCKKVRDLKIVIPNRLRSIYELLTK